MTWKRDPETGLRVSEKTAERLESILTWVFVAPFALLLVGVFLGLGAGSVVGLVIVGVIVWSLWSG